MYLYFTDLDFRWTMQGGLKMLSIRHAGSRFARGATPCESSRVVKCLIRILLRFKNEDGSCIIISRILTSRSADRRRANRVES